jgi:hypothetical protein
MAPSPTFHSTIQLNGTTSTMYIDGTVINTGGFGGQNGINKTIASSINGGTNELIIRDLKIITNNSISINDTAPNEGYEIRVIHSVAANTDSFPSFPIINAVNPFGNPNSSSAFFDPNVI